jgi:signal transduction histidine kinase
MSSRERQDHWRSSLDAVEALRVRIAEVPDPHRDVEATQLMAQVAHAKSSSFRALLHSSGHVLDVNPVALIFGGVDLSEVVGLPLWATPWWAAAPPDDVRRLASAVKEAGAGLFTRFDVPLHAIGREPETLDLMIRPLRGRDGRVAFIVAEGRNITDRKRVEERLSRQNAELSALTERLARVHDYRERLLAELSHDLRAPLQAVVTRSEQVLRSDPAAEVRGQVMHIRIAALGALEQVNDMLEQVKADHGERQLALVDADLASAVRAVAETFRPLAEDRRIALSVEAPETLPARFDVERMGRIVSNLLANAIRHAPPEGSVDCVLSADGEQALLEVADSGPGVPVEHRDHVFGRYRSGLRGDGRARGAGAGLGLAIVREFVELHGGTVSLGEAELGGALFMVSLPLQPPDGQGVRATLAQEVAAAQRTEYVRSALEAELAAGEITPQVPTVVIVEQAAGRAEAIAKGIGEVAITCLAGDAGEALRLADDLRPEAIIVGTAPGEMPATSLLRRLAGDERLTGIKRMALLGERDSDPPEDALVMAGAQLVLPAGDAGELGRRLWAAAAALGD